MKIKLDARTIAALQLPAGKDEDFAWDTELENFGLRLRRRTDGGLSRSFIVQYRAGRRTRRPTIGSADKITPAQARDAARKHLAQVELGQRSASREGGEAGAGDAHGPRHGGDLSRGQAACAQARIIPDRQALSGRTLLRGTCIRWPLTAVTRTDVAACIRTIAFQAQRARPRRRPGGRCPRSLPGRSPKGCWATAPTRSTARAGPMIPTSRDHIPTEAELVAIWNACGDDDFGRIVRLLILLGNRRQEVGGMRWSELDLTAGAWTLPAERSKNHRSLTVVLPPAALAIIQSMPRTSRDCLFGDRAGSGFTGWTNAKAELDRRLGSTVRPWRLHDLRRGVATGLIDLGIAPHVVEACLNHYSGHRAGVAGVYNKSDYTAPDCGGVGALEPSTCSPLSRAARATSSTLQSA